MSRAPLAGESVAALGPYLRAIRSRWRLFALVTLAAIAAAAISLTARAPTYRTTAQLLVTPLPQDDRTFLGITMLRDSGDPTRTMQTAAALVVSPEAARITAQRLGGGVTQGSVESAIKVEPLGESNILAVTATARSAALSAALASGYAKNALDLRSTALRAQIDRAIAALRKNQRGAGSALSVVDAGLIADLSAVRDRGDPSLSLAKTADVPTGPTNTPDWLILALALIAGLTLGAIVAVLLERFDPRVRDADELVSLVPVPILARVPSVERRTRGTYAMLTAPAVRESFQTLQILLDQRRLPKSRRSNTILITSASDGDGKTTTAICLSLALVAAGHEVVLIDCDLRRPTIGLRLGLDRSLGLATFMSTPTTLAELLQPVMGLPALRVLTDGASDMRLLPSGLTTLLEEAARLADYVIVDTASLGVVGDALAFAPDADERLLVGRPHNSDRRAVWHMRELLERAGTPPTGWVVIRDDTTRHRHAEAAPVTPRDSEPARVSAPAVDEPTGSPTTATPRVRRTPAAGGKVGGAKPSPAGGRVAAAKPSPAGGEVAAAKAPPAGGEGTTGSASRTRRPRRTTARPVAPAAETPSAPPAAPAPTEPESGSDSPSASGGRVLRPESDAAVAKSAAARPIRGNAE